MTSIEIPGTPEKDPNEGFSPSPACLSSHSGLTAESIFPVAWFTVSEVRPQKPHFPPHPLLYRSLLHQNVWEWAYGITEAHRGYNIERSELKAIEIGDDPIKSFNVVLQLYQEFDGKSLSNGSVEAGMLLVLDGMIRGFLLLKESSLWSRGEEIQRKEEDLKEREKVLIADEEEFTRRWQPLEG
jgi:hypothetical protein